MSTKIYTKTGDKGATSLIGGTKVPKSHLRIETYGTVDELNSFVGLLRDQLALAEIAIPEFEATPTPGREPNHGDEPGQGHALTFGVLREELLGIQDRLFTLGSSLACDPEKEPKLKIPDLKEEDITALEKSIDQMDNVLPPIKTFVLPGGHVAVSTAHVVRCICRRAERACVRMQEEGLFVEPIIIRYLNRLSDYFFEAARYIAYLLGAKENPWRPRV